ncbi:hypothetical protein MMC34_006570 [Xylographa carneopallida]|nr:hypothetical protein [Xylographa carneopallida]
MGMKDDSLERAADIKGELVMVRLRALRDQSGFDFLDAFIRDELSKGRYDPAIAKICFEMLLELFERTLKIDVGKMSGSSMVVENVC